MTRRKTFVVRVVVSGEFMRGKPEVARALVNVALIDQAREPLTGPRGGRYLPVGEPFDFQDGIGGDDWHRDDHTFTARVVGRYVRPVPA